MAPTTSLLLQVKRNLFTAAVSGRLRQMGLLNLYIWRCCGDMNMSHLLAASLSVAAA